MRSKTVYDNWSPEVCRDRHGSLAWVTGVLFSVLGLVLVVLGWSLTKSYSASSQAEIIEVKLQDNREAVKEDIGDLKSWLRSISAKQDKTNETLQRLEAVQEKGKPK